MSTLQRRKFWLFLSLSGLIFELIGYFFFQKFLLLPLCEYCVYIRFSFLVIILATLFIAIAPIYKTIRILGSAVGLYASLHALIWSFQYLSVIKIVSATPKAPQRDLCSATASFPLGIPLDQWFPDFFAPISICNEELWDLMGITMPEWIICIFASYLLIFLLVILADARRAFERLPD